MSKYFLSDVRSNSLEELAEAVCDTPMGNTMYAIAEDKLVEFEKEAVLRSAPLMQISVFDALKIMMA